MVQFRGCDTTKEIRILNKIPLRYSLIFLLPTLVGTVLTVFGIFMFMIIFTLENKLFTFYMDNDPFIYTLFFLPPIFISIYSMTSLHDIIFNKNISLYDERSDTYRMYIDNKEIIFKKNEIEKVKFYQFHAKPGILIKGMLVVKIRKKTYRFSSKKNLNYLLSMEQHFNEWKSNSKS